MPLNKKPKLTKLLALAVFVLLLLFGSCAESRAWYNVSWGKRIKITIDDSKVNGTVANFPVYVNLDDLPDAFFDDVLASGADLRVTKSDGITEVAREVVALSKTANTGEMHFVANGNLTNAANSDYYLYYKNPLATEPAASGIYGKNNVWAANYVSVWHLHESPTGTIYNSVSASYNCTSYGSMLSSNRITGVLSGNGTSFDGSDDYLDCADINELDAASKFTITGWAKRNSASNQVILLDKYTDANNRTQSWYYSGLLYGLICNSGLSYGTVANNDSNWHHTAMIFDGNLSGNSKLKTYIDSSLQTLSFTGTIPATTANQTTTVKIGRASGSFYTNGRVDEIRVSSLALSGSWIKTEYNNQNSTTTFYRLSSPEDYGDYTNMTDPTVLTLSPADNATAVSPSANLVINFSEIVETQSGNITIKKSSDNSTVATIDVMGGLVTGSGTTSITINPGSDLAAGTEYYVLVDASAFDDMSGNNYAGILDTTTWSFTTACSNSRPGYWYDCNWAKRIKITIDDSQVDGTVANFPVYVNLNGMPASFFDDVLAAGADLRVTKSDGITEVAREVVALSKTANTGEMHFVANGNLTNAANSDYYLYYKNPLATGPAASEAYGKNNVWANNYVSVWHLNESPTGTIYNSVSASYNCTSYGSMLSSNRITGVLSGNGTSFDGSDDYLDCDDINELDSASKFTITGWAKRNSTSNTVTLLDKYTNGSNRIQSWYVGSQLYGTIYNSGVNSDALVNTNDTNWHHTATTFDGSLSGNSKLKMYMDSCSRTLSFGGTIPATTPNQTATVTIGRGINGPHFYTNGRVDEVRVSSLALSDSWIKTEYRNQNAPSTFYRLSSPEDHIDTIDPTILTLSPADNATSVAVNANLVITFDEAIDIQSGNVTIKKSSDNSPVATIDVMGGLVTGNGTTSITINPGSDLAAGTEYYAQIDASAFGDMSGNNYAGISDTTTWSFTTDCTNSDPGDWYNCNWVKRIKITIDDSKVNGTVANFPVYVNLDDFPDDFFDDVLANGADLRVTKSDGITEVAREVLTLSKTANTGEMHFVANGNLTNAANSDYYLYYKNPFATEPAASGTYGKNNVWANNYRAVWHLNESVNNTTDGYTDSTSYTNHGTGTSMAVAASTGKLSAKAQEFDGSADYITVADSISLEPTVLTLSSWVKVGSVMSGSAYVIVKNADPGSRGTYNSYSQNHYEGGSNDFTDDAIQYKGYISNTPRTLASLLGAPTIPTCPLTYDWVNVVHTYDGSTLKYYRDGILRETASYSGAIWYDPSTGTGCDEPPGGDLYIGSAGAVAYFQGLIDEIRIAGVARDGSWIKTEYNNQSSPSTFYRISTFQNSSDPTVSSFLPADNATVNVSSTTNLSIAFSEPIDIQTGNINIYENGVGLLETISVTSGAVTGNGGTTIYINPTNSFNANSDYYVRIDGTAFHDMGANSYAGITNNGTWNFTTGCLNSRTSEWSNCGWAKRLPITIDKAMINGSVTNFPVYLNLDDLPDNFFDDVLANGADLRVTKSDGISEVARELVWLNKVSNGGEMHFLADSLTNASNATYYLYYQNPTATEPAASDTYGKNNVWTNNYRAVWHMHEPVNNTASGYKDATSYTNHGTGTSMGVAASTGKLSGNAQEFDGSADYITVPDSTNLEPTTLTLSSWVKIKGAGSHATGAVWLAKGARATQPYRSYSQMYADDPGGVPNHIYHGVGLSCYEALGISTTIFVPTTNWTYVVTTYDRSTLKLYIKGSLERSDASSYAINYGFVDDTLHIGDWGLASSVRRFQGLVDEVRIASGARNANWIKTEFNNQNGSSLFYRVSSVEPYGVPPVIISTVPPAETPAYKPSEYKVNFDKTIITPNTSANLTCKNNDSAGAILFTVPFSSISVSGSQLTVNFGDKFYRYVGFKLYCYIDSGNVTDTQANTQSYNFTLRAPSQIIGL